MAKISPIRIQWKKRISTNQNMQFFIGVFEDIQINGKNNVNSFFRYRRKNLNII